MHGILSFVIFFVYLSCVDVFFLSLFPVTALCFGEVFIESLVPFTPWMKQRAQLHLSVVTRHCYALSNTSNQPQTIGLSLPLSLSLSLSLSSPSLSPSLTLMVTANVGVEGHPADCEDCQENAKKLRREIFRGEQMKELREMLGLKYVLHSTGENKEKRERHRERKRTL